MPNYQIGAWQCLTLVQCYLIPLAPVGLVLIHCARSDNTVIPSYQLDFAIYCVSSDLLALKIMVTRFCKSTNINQNCCTKVEHSESLCQAIASHASKLNPINTYTVHFSLGFLFHQCELGLSTQRTSLISRWPKTSRV